MTMPVDSLTFDSKPGNYILETIKGQLYEFKIPEDILHIAEMLVPDDAASWKEFAPALVVGVYSIMAKVGEPAVVTLDNHDASDLREFITDPVASIVKTDAEG